MNETTPRRRWKGPAILMVIGGVLCVGGVAAYLLSFFYMFSSLLPSAQAGGPGTMVVETDPGDTVTIYADTHGAVASGYAVDLNAYPGLALEAVDEHGNVLTITPGAEGAMTQSSGGSVSVGIAEVVSPGGAVTINASNTPGAGSVPRSLSAGVDLEAGPLFTFIGVMVVVMLLAIAGGPVFIGGLVWLIVVLATGPKSR